MATTGQDDSEASEPMSDADPDELLNSLKNIDDLDAELFGPKKSLSSKAKDEKATKPKSEKKVSFHESVPSKAKDKNISSRRKQVDLDFDFDDPLADILSDDDNAFSPNSSAKSGAKKESAADDWLFADDDADDLLDDGGGVKKEKQKSPEKQPRMSVKSLMQTSTTDDLLKRPSGGVKKMTLDDFASSAAKLSPEKIASPYTAAPASATTKKEISFDDEFGFGSYQPTITTPTDTTKRGRGSRRPPSDGSDFFDFLKEEDNVRPSRTDNEGDVAQSSAPAKAPISRRLQSPTRPSIAEIPTGRVDTEGNERPRPRTSDNMRTRVTLQQEQMQEKKEVVYDTPIVPSAGEIKMQKQELLDGFPVSPGTSRTPPPVSTPLPRASRRSAESPFTSGRPPPSPQLPVSSPALPKPVSSPFQQTYQASDVTHTPATNVADDGQLQSLDAHLAHTRALLHNTELGYRADLEIMKTTYDSRIELLRSSFEDLKSRLDRELDSVRESYSARIAVLRDAMQSHALAETSKECDHQEEIKRLRNLHLEALEECRRDGETQIERLRQAHVTEIDAIKNSTLHARNIESMMSRVDDATNNLQQLSTKYESAYRAVTQQSESVSLGNKQLISVMQNQLSQQQRSTSDAQIQLQQTASRIEGMISEMNRKMEEQHYSMQLSHSNLQAAHAALQEERKQFMQQITMEREHLRKAHREMINLQVSTQQEAREDRSKLMRAVDDLTTSVAKFEETKIAEAERATLRNREHEEKINQLNAEKLEVAKKKAQIEAAESKLASRELELTNRLSQFEKEERILQQIQADLEQREAEMQMLAQKAMQSGAENEKAIADAKRVEEGQSRKLAEIHAEMKEVAKQRQLLAEERKALAEERNTGSGTFVPSMTSSPVTNAVVTPSRTPANRQLMIGHPGSPGQNSGATMVLWRHKAQQDHSFLEDEQFFLETLKNSPYSKKN